MPSAHVHIYTCSGGIGGGRGGIGGGRGGMLSFRLLSLSDLVDVGVVEAGFSSLLVCVGGGCSGTVKNIQVLSNTVIVYIHPRQVSNFGLKTTRNLPFCKPSTVHY